MAENIVVLCKRHGHKEDRSWMCPTAPEASRMVRWLKDNAIDAQSLDQEQWERLPNYELGGDGT